MSVHCPAVGCEGTQLETHWTRCVFGWPLQLGGSRLHGLVSPQVLLGRGPSLEVWVFPSPLLSTCYGLGAGLAGALHGLTQPSQPQKLHGSDLVSTSRRGN